MKKGEVSAAVRMGDYVHDLGGFNPGMSIVLMDDYFEMDFNFKSLASVYYMSKLYWLTGDNGHDEEKEMVEDENVQVNLNVEDLVIALEGEFAPRSGGNIRCHKYWGYDSCDDCLDEVIDLTDEHFGVKFCFGGGSTMMIVVNVFPGFLWSFFFDGWNDLEDDVLVVD